MSYKIVSDSSSNLLKTDLVPFSSVPLKVITATNEYIDDSNLDVQKMVSDLEKYKGTSKTACPNVDEWFKAFEDYDNIFCVTITSSLSGSYNSACIALEDYLQKNPGKKGYVIDTLSVGPESTLIIEKLCELIKQELDFKEIKEAIIQYQKSTRLIFCLDSLRNLANNGRVSPAVAKIAGVLGIRIVGKASLKGTLEITNKTRGSSNAITTVFKNMIKEGYSGGKLHIHHCQNLKAASALESMVKAVFPKSDIILKETGALCSFYAESGGLLVGFEGN